MNQMDLFDSETTEAEATEKATLSICSGRVGPIRFGSTDASYALTKDVLTDLAIQCAAAGKGSS